MRIYPLKFRSIYKRRIWGGQKLREVFGKDIPAGEKIGESWELAELPEDKSVIINGELAGETIDEALKKYPREITGDENFSGQFPLLIKFLDCQDILSVQVHPDRQTCERMGEGEPKSECWYVIDAAAGAVIYKGLKEGVTKKLFAEAIEKGGVAELLAKVEVKAGECHYLPAGTPHSIGAGILIAEIQTPSDTTYRVYDWDRVDGSGKGRELHIGQALESIHFDASSDDFSVTTAGRLADCEYFKVDKFKGDRGSKTALSSGKMRVFMIIRGEGAFFDDSGPEPFKAGDTILIPAEYRGEIEFKADSEYLTISL